MYHNKTKKNIIRNEEFTLDSIEIYPPSTTPHTEDLQDLTSIPSETTPLPRDHHYQNFSGKYNVSFNQFF